MAVDNFEAKPLHCSEGSNENALKGKVTKRGADNLDFANEEESADEEKDPGSVAVSEDSEDEGASSAEEPEDSEDDAFSDSDSDEEFVPQSLPAPPPRISFVYRDPPSLQTPPPKPRLPSPQTSPVKREPLRPSPLKPRKSLPLSPFDPRPIPQPSFISSSFADEQRFLQNTERLMSRVLAEADAEGYGFANEMGTSAASRWIHLLT